MKSSKKLINEPADAVTEFLSGYVSSIKHVQLLEGSPDVRCHTEASVLRHAVPPVAASKAVSRALQINVVVDVSPVAKDKVAIISGAAPQLC